MLEGKWKLRGRLYNNFEVNKLVKNSVTSRSAKVMEKIIAYKLNLQLDHKQRKEYLLQEGDFI